MTDSSPVLITVRGLVKSYGDNPVLRGVDLDLHREKINIVIGGSGAGKTVLMRQLIAIERPDAGSIRLEELELTTLDERELNGVRKRFGMVFQGSALFDSMSVFDNVAFPLREAGRLSRGQLRQRVMDKLAALGVDAAAPRFPGDISGGMRKRVAVARALVMEPEILIYDEPTAGLDPLAARNVDRLIAETAERFAVTSVVITHDLATCYAIGDRVSMLHEGRIRVTCLPADLPRSADEVVARFVAAARIALPASSC